MNRRLASALVVAVLALTAGCSAAGSPTAGPTAPATVAPTTATSPSPSPSTTDDESRPGTTAWRLRRAGTPDAIEGYADAVSVLPGQPFRLFVSTTARSWTVTAFRMGWYGGTLAREVWRSPRQPGVRQPPARVVGSTYTPVADWQPSLEVATSAWSPGDYLLLLRSAAGDERYVPITVRSPDTAGRIVIVNAVTTWAAYDDWGGRSLYQGPGGPADFIDRARAVSFDRPYANGDGAGEFVIRELALVALAERLRLPLAFATDVDLHADPHLLDRARAVVTLGHDEYWSAAERSEVTKARDRGVNVAFLGANAVFRHIRFAPTALGPNRLMIDYKFAEQDPIYATDPKAATGDWPAPPYPRPESDLTGSMYECNPVRAGLVVADPSSWLFAGAHVVAGTRLPGLVHPEYDHVTLGLPTPRPMDVLFHSPVVCQGKASYADAVYYSTPSGAGVFDAATLDWVRGLRNGAGSRRSQTIITAVTTRLLRAFAAGPAGAVHPARDNLARFYPSFGPPPQ